MYYTNLKGKKAYGKLFDEAKLIMGITKDNTPMLDSKGEYGTTAMSLYIKDDLAKLKTRKKQLESDFAKFWFETGRQECTGNKQNGAIYLDAAKLFPDIPLSITTDEAIYKWLGLTHTEIAVVNKYARVVDAKAQKRIDNRNKKTS